MVEEDGMMEELGVDAMSVRSGTRFSNPLLPEEGCNINGMSEGMGLKPCDCVCFVSSVVEEEGGRNPANDGGVNEGKDCELVELVENEKGGMVEAGFEEKSKVGKVVESPTLVLCEVGEMIFLGLTKKRSMSVVGLKIFSNVCG